LKRVGLGVQKVTTAPRRREEDRGDSRSPGERSED
jgi:hypothetical protein